MSPSQSLSYDLKSKMITNLTVWKHILIVHWTLPLDCTHELPPAEALMNQMRSRIEIDRYLHLTKRFCLESSFYFIIFTWMEYLGLSKIIPWPNQAMELYLVWDSESETTKDGTLMTTDMTVEDASSSDDDSPSRKRKKSRGKNKSKKKKKRSSTSSSTEDSEAFWFVISTR